MGEYVKMLPELKGRGRFYSVEAVTGRKIKSTTVLLVVYEGFVYFIDFSQKRFVS